MKFKNCRCAHCLVEFEDLTSDHAFPRSWYPDSTPKDLEKWQAPCCERCNNRMSKMEEDLLTRLGLCINPEAPECSGIAEKVLRSANPKYAKNEKDKRFREAKLKKIFRSLKPISSAKPNQTLVAFSPDAHGPLVEIEKKLLEQFGEKFIRGITYAIDGTYIEEDYDITVSYVVVPMEEFDALAKEYCELHERGPGLIFFMGRAKEDLNSKMFLIRIFGSLVLRAIVIPKKYADVIDARIQDERQNQT